MVLEFVVINQSSIARVMTALLDNYIHQVVRELLMDWPRNATWQAVGSVADARWELSLS
jgi:hypothetical protein